MKKTRKCCKSCCCSQSVKDKLRIFMPQLREICSASPEKRLKLIKRVPACLIKLLSESSLNILKGNIKLKSNQYEKLKPYKRQLLLVSRPKISLSKRRAVFGEKKGGWLPALIPVVIGLVAQIAGKAAGIL